MSQRELDRYEIIKRSMRREITVPKAGELLSLTERQIYNLKAKIKEQGAQGLIHASRGKPSNRKIPEKERVQIESIVRRNYYDFGPTHVSEKLEENHGIKRDPKTVKTIMAAIGLWKPRQRRKVQYRCQRARKEHYGEMEQFDGSYEHWFEDRGKKCCLLASIDDATSKIPSAMFAEHEGTFPVFLFWKQYILEHGKPRTIYLDKLKTYLNNHPDVLGDEDMLTQFQRAMKELGIEPITAHSPQAKGRIENLFKTLQDRLVKEMRLKNISDPETANRFLKEDFLPWFNAKYSKEPKKKANLHRKLSSEEKKQLGSILSMQTERTVQNDFTFRFKNQWFQLQKKQPATVRPKDRIIMEERLDGSLKARLRGKYLNYALLPDKPEKQNIQPWIIPASLEQDSPWRKSFAFGSRGKTASINQKT